MRGFIIISIIVGPLAHGDVYYIFSLATLPSLCHGNIRVSSRSILLLMTERTHIAHTGGCLVTDVEGEKIDLRYFFYIIINNFLK